MSIINQSKFVIIRLSTESDSAIHRDRYQPTLTSYWNFHIAFIINKINHTTIIKWNEHITWKNKISWLAKFECKLAIACDVHSFHEPRQEYRVFPSWRHTIYLLYYDFYLVIIDVVHTTEYYMLLTYHLRWKKTNAIFKSPNVSRRFHFNRKKK